MYLVNAGTNKQKPSRRISDIDPRDGAAVVGHNGVGKTTTLRLAPLFLGHLPSQIVQSGHGQKSMARFVLPTPESAIVFEYQRGPSEVHDVRVAVLRARRDNPDAIEYRFFETSFRRELFLDASGTFLDDEGSIAAARALGVRFTQKYTSAADYRSIILNTRSNSKDAHKLRAVARDFAFAPKPMANLDRLVAAVVKDHVSFGDLIQVAVGMVHEEIGASGGTERNKVQLKQTKAEIREWINNRRACEEAEKLAPKITEINQGLEDFVRQENELRLLGSEARALLEHKTGQFSSKTAERDEASRARAMAIIGEQETHQRLADERAAAEQAQRDASQAHQDQQYKKDRFEKADAEKWYKEQDRIPRLTADREQIIAEQTIYETRFSQVKAAIDNEINAAKDRVTEARDTDFAALEEEVEEAESRHAIDSGALVTQREEAIVAAQQRHAKRATELAEAIGKNREQLARVNALAERVEGPPELREVVANLREQFDEANEKLREATACQARQQRQCSDAGLDFERAEQDVLNAQRAIASVKAEIADLEKRLSPNEGTLLATLRQQPDEAWSSLAKIISPDLLGRADLSPGFDDERADFGAYGWVLDLDKIGRPSWADVNDLRGQLADAKQRLDQAQALCEEVVAKQAETSARHQTAQQELTSVDAALSIAEKNKTTTYQALERAKFNLDEARKNERKQFDDDIARLKAAVTDGELQRAKYASSAEGELDGIKQRYETQSWNLQAARAKEVTGFKKRKDDIKLQANSNLRALEEQRNAKLLEANMDPAKIEAWKVARQKIDAQLKEIRDNTDLVNQWRDWLKDNGPAELVKLQEKLAEANTALSTANKGLTDHGTACRRAAEAFNVQDSTLEALVRGLDEQCRRLQTLADELPWMPNAEVSIDTEMNASELEGDVQVARRRLAETEGKINGIFNYVYERLTAQETNVKDFIERSLSEAATASRIDRARILARCHDRIPSEIVSNLNNTLRAILDTIEHFYGAILRFESEIHRFNKRLSDGLNAVQPFERISGLQIEMVPDFTDLGFMDRIKAVSRYARESHTAIGRPASRTQIPGTDAENVLWEFASTIAGTGRLEVDLASHIRLQGRVRENDVEKVFQRESELENVSSNGLTSIILITLLIGMLNIIRGDEQVYVTWVTDEVGKFDGPNFIALMDMLRDNRIDVITASPDLNPRHYKKFAHRYRFEDLGVIRMFAPTTQQRGDEQEVEPVVSETSEVTS